jgi:hypothetical protein
MLARIARLALTAVVLSAVGTTVAVLVYLALGGDPEAPAPGPRRVTVPPSTAARPWLAPAPPDEYRVDPADEPDPGEPVSSLTRGKLVLVLGLCLLLAIAVGVAVAAALGPGSSLV